MKKLMILMVICWTLLIPSMGLTAPSGVYPSEIKIHMGGINLLDSNKVVRASIAGGQDVVLGQNSNSVFTFNAIPPGTYKYIQFVIDGNFGFKAQIGGQYTHDINKGGTVSTDGNGNISGSLTADPSLYGFIEKVQTPATINYDIGDFTVSNDGQIVNKVINFSYSCQQLDVVGANVTFTNITPIVKVDGKVVESELQEG